MIVIDSSAVVAFLLRERGHEIVARRLSTSCISAVNFSEVLARMTRDLIEPQQLAPKLLELGLTLVDFDRSQAIVAGEIRETARLHGIGFADCCCVALAITRDLPVLTADRAWQIMADKVSVEFLR